MANKVGAKIVLLGTSNGGKTCLVQRYLRSTFNEDTACTVGAAFGSKEEKIDDKLVTLQIWDTAGSEQYEAMSRFYYRGAIVAIICYDLTDTRSFGKVKFWVNELRKNQENCEIFLCGTKLDLIQNGESERMVSNDSATDYAKDINAKVFETSSRTGENVWELFYEVAKTCSEKVANAPKPVKGTVSLRQAQPKKRKRC